jgi:hypothetical protein
VQVCVHTYTLHRQTRHGNQGRYHGPDPHAAKGAGARGARAWAGGAPEGRRGPVIEEAARGRGSRGRVRKKTEAAPAGDRGPAMDSSGASHGRSAMCIQLRHSIGRSLRKQGTASGVRSHHCCVAPWAHRVACRLYRVACRLYPLLHRHLALSSPFCTGTTDTLVLSTSSHHYGDIG